MLKITEKLHVTNRNEWRSWLLENHETKKGVWLLSYRKNTGKPNIPYDDAVEEALCFGWIDSIIKRIDGEKFARKFTPRKNKSKWSESNKRRARKMVKAGKMTVAGLALIKEAMKTGEWQKTTPAEKELVVPSYFRKALAANKRAQVFFDNLANSHKRNIVGWVTSAKKEETRRRRLAEAIRFLEQKKKLGLK